MRFEDFINADESIVMVLSVDEYEKSKDFFKEFYTPKQIKDIDEFCKFKPLSDKFLLCNRYKINQITTPIMYENAVTFSERVPYGDIVFRKENTGDMNSVKIRQFLREDIKLVLLASVSEDYVDAILEQYDTVRKSTFIDAVVEDVTVNSDYQNKGCYNNDDIRLAIGRELVARLGK